MKKNLFITAIIAIVLCISCGPKGTSHSNASEEEKVDYKELVDEVENLMQ